VLGIWIWRGAIAMLDATSSSVFVVHCAVSFGVANFLCFPKKREFPSYVWLRLSTLLDKLDRQARIDK
jgi:hypothetical protein